jgi:hypothetical protein
MIGSLAKTRAGRSSVTRYAYSPSWARLAMTATVMPEGIDSVNHADGSRDERHVDTPCSHLMHQALPIGKGDNSQWVTMCRLSAGVAEDWLSSACSKHISKRIYVIAKGLPQFTGT